MSVKKKSPISWIFQFAGEKKSAYWLSIFMAILSVACSIVPYVLIARIVSLLLGGVRDWSVYTRECGIIALFWFGNVFFHMLSTAKSHVATFSLLGNIRKALCDKLGRVPLGSVLDLPSGSLKNILVERIDSMETTLAHIVPEYTSNMLLPLAMFAYLLTIDWRMALASLATLPVGLVAFSLMLIGAQERFDFAIQKTKALNDTAVEYINGIEVIKAFGKSKSSYEKFVTAAKEGSDCYVEWMRDCIWYQSFAMVVAPSTLLAVLPIGGLFFLRGSLGAVDFITIIILSMSIIQPFLTIMTYHDDISKAGVIFGEVGSIMELPELGRPKKDAATPFDNSIVLKDVRFSYKKGGESLPPASHSVAPTPPSAGQAPCDVCGANSITTPRKRFCTA